MRQNFDIRRYKNGEWKYLFDSEKSLFEWLGFRPGDNPTTEEIKEAYLKRSVWWSETSKKVSKSRGEANPELTEISLHIKDAFINLKKASDTLMDPIKRSLYEQELMNKEIRKAEEELIRYVQFSLRDRVLSREEKQNLINEATILNISADRAVELIETEMKTVGASYKGEGSEGNAFENPIEAIYGKTYYDILGVAESAVLDEIMEAYKKLVTDWKKRSTKDPVRAAGMFTLLDDARRELSDRKKRAQYDEKLRIKRESSDKFTSVLDFRSGEKARSLLEAANLVDKYWDEGKTKLVSGDLAGWLGRNGNSVLAEEIRAVEKLEGDKDIALEKALQAFKVGLPNPVLKVEPLSIDIGKIESGKTIVRTIRILNDGTRGCLYGEVNTAKTIKGVTFSLNQIVLLPGQHHEIEIKIDTTDLPVKHAYNIKADIKTNSSKSCVLSILLEITHPISKSINKVVGYSLVGGIIGVLIRGLLGYPDWLQQYYTSGTIHVPSMHDVDVQAGNLHIAENIGVVFVFVMIVLSPWIIPKIKKTLK